jgi:ABC-type transport system involved in multi-copper enzyme maturation permease subunit
MTQVFAIAGITLGEAIRRRVLLIILMVGLAFLIIAPGLNELTPRGGRQVLLDMTLGIIKITSAILAVTLTVYLLPNEVERRTIYTILSKPVQRYQFLLGKYLGSVGALSLMIAMMTVVLLIAFVLQQKTFEMQYIAPLVKAPIMLVFQMSLLAAVAMFSTFVTPVVNFFLTGLVYIFGTLLNPFFEAVSGRGGSEGLSIVAKISHYVFPNFQNLDISGGVAQQMEQQLRANETVYMLNGIIYSIVYTAILIVLAVMIFDRKEV